MDCSCNKIGCKKLTTAADVSTPCLSCDSCTCNLPPTKNCNNSCELPDNSTSLNKNETVAFNCSSCIGKNATSELCKNCSKSPTIEPQVKNCSCICSNATSSCNSQSDCSSFILVTNCSCSCSQTTGNVLKQFFSPIFAITK